MNPSAGFSISYNPETAMKNADYKYSWLQIALLLLPIPILAILWRQLPDAVPMHWNLRGEIDRWGPKWTLLMLPAINAACWLLLQFIPQLDPRIRQNPEQHERTLRFLRLAQFGMVALLTLLSLLVIAAAAGGELDVARVILIALLCLFVVLGNFLPSVKQNYFVGLRTPWTLDDPRNWQATHRLGGRLLCFGALVLLVLQMLLPLHVATILMIVYLAGFAVWGMVYSFMYSRRLRSFDTTARGG